MQGDEALKLPPTILYEKQDHVAIVTINRPEAMSSLTSEMLTAMDAAFDDFDRDPELWVAILTGAGEKAFSAGMDLEQGLRLAARPERPCPPPSAYCPVRLRGAPVRGPRNSSTLCALATRDHE